MNIAVFQAIIMWLFLGAALAEHAFAARGISSAEVELRDAVLAGACSLAISVATVVWRIDESEVDYD